MLQRLIAIRNELRKLQLCPWHGYLRTMSHWLRIPTLPDLLSLKPIHLQQSSGPSTNPLGRQSMAELHPVNRGPGPKAQAPIYMLLGGGPGSPDLLLLGREMKQNRAPLEGWMGTLAWGFVPLTVLSRNVYLAKGGHKPACRDPNGAQPLGQKGQILYLKKFWPQFWGAQLLELVASVASRLGVPFGLCCLSAARARFGSRAGLGCHSAFGASLPLASARASVVAALVAGGLWRQTRDATKSSKRRGQGRMFKV